MDVYLGLKPWPDVIPVLKALKDAGIRLRFLSNFTREMLTSCIAASGLDGMLSFFSAQTG